MRRILGITLLCILYRLGSCNELWGSPVTSGVARPFELLIYRNPETLACSHVSVRETQVFMNLPHEGYLDAFVTEHGDEKIQFIHSDVDFLHHEISSLCGEEYPRDHYDGVLSSLSQTSDEQVVLGNGGPGSSINRNAHLDLDVEIHELVRSGPSDNRVDLVFFSDGCMFHLVLTLQREILPKYMYVQIHRKRNLSSSTTQCASPWISLIIRLSTRSDR